MPVRKVHGLVRQAGAGTLGVQPVVTVAFAGDREPLFYGDDPVSSRPIYRQCQWPDV